VLKNWVKLQHEYDCFFFVADWHALTTHYESPAIIERERLGHGHRLAGRRRQSGHAPSCSSSRAFPSTPNCTCCCP
jgi:hypothetical protein